MVESAVELVFTPCAPLSSGMVEEIYGYPAESQCFQIEAHGLQSKPIMVPHGRWGERDDGDSQHQQPKG